MMLKFDPLRFIADHAGMALADAISEAYRQGQQDAQPNQSVQNVDTISRQDAIDAAIEAVDEWDGGCNLTRADMIADAINNTVPSAQPDNSCDGCRYENADDGVLVPCGFCKRSHPDNYERRTDGTD